MGKGCSAHKQSSKKTTEHHTPTFGEFFSSGQAERVSPFLTIPSRRWAKNLPLRSSMTAALLLLIAFAVSFVSELEPLMNLCLVAVYFLSGIPALIDSTEEILDFDISIDILMTSPHSLQFYSEARWKEPFSSYCLICRDP